MELSLSEVDYRAVNESILEYFETTRTAKKDGHLAYMVDGKCLFSFNFTTEQLLSLPAPDEVTITFKEAATLALGITDSLIKEEMFSYLIKAFSKHSAIPLVFIKSLDGEGLFIVGSQVVIILVKEKNKSYEATLAGAIVH